MILPLLSVFAPLLGFFLTALGSKNISPLYSQFVTCFFMGLSVVGAFFVFYHVNVQGEVIDIPLMTWIQIENFKSEWGFHFDVLSSIMVIVVTLISFLVHIYAIGYMHHDLSIPRFMAYLSLFTFMMLMLVTANNFIQLFFGWEGVGLASYLLIGFWYDKPSANEAAMKAFVINRVGDLGLILGIAATYSVFGTVEFNEIFLQVSSKSTAIFMVGDSSFPAIEIICLLLFIGAMGKSAQIGFHTWLPDAMEGPTPVSALIHAATMVTAGVFLLAKCSPLYHLAPLTSQLITIVGATTAFFAGTVALTQNDIKRVIAYSTCSQLGYMFFAAGLSAYHLSLFHLVTHAFFKALLFLGAGAVIHSMSDEQDMRAMGGIWRFIPLTYVMMVIGSCALAGLPYFAGYYSKDAILELAGVSHSFVGNYAYGLGLLSAFLTALYSWRLLCLTFMGQPRASEMVMSHIHESSLTMLVPLLILSAGAIFAGAFGVHYFLNPAFWRGSIVFSSLEVSHGSSFLEILPTLLALSGIGIAYLFYAWKTEWPSKLANKYQTFYLFLLNKWYFDQLYEWLFVRSALILGKNLWLAGEVKIIDRWGPDGITKLTLHFSDRVSRLQTGYLSDYAYSMVLGIAGFIAWLILF